MSQNEPKQPESSEGQRSESQAPESQPPKSQPSVTQSSTTEQTVSFLKTKLKAITVRILRTTIDTLERVADNLEGVPSARPILSPEMQEKLGALWQRFLTLWRGLLTQLRSRLPENLQQLSDRTLTGMVVGVFVVLFWFTSSLFSPKPTQVSTAPQSSKQVAPQPSKKVTPKAPNGVIPKPSQPFPSELTAPDSAPSSLPIPTVAVSPSPEPEKSAPKVEKPTSKPEESTPKAEKPTPEVAKSIPEPEKSAPKAEKTTSQPEKSIPRVEKPTLEPEKSTPEVAKSIPKPEKSTSKAEKPAPKVEKPVPPQVVLTPAQSLLASIQDQVTTVSDRYTNNLVESIQANFRTSRLVVKVRGGWYDLSADQQNQLADDLLKRSQELDFSKLDLTDTQGTVLARSPVVGSSMVILKRKQDAQTTV